MQRDVRAFVSGRHLLQLPGPTNVPDRVLRAIAKPTIDHRGTEFRTMYLSVVEGLRGIFQTEGQIAIWPSSGTGASEAALVNTLSPGDRVLAFETGYFSDAWAAIARRLAIRVDYIAGDWRHPADYADLAERLADDLDHQIKAVMVVHNETSTGVRSDIARVRRELDQAGHPALLLVDVVSSLASSEYRHDEWGVDVAFAGSQKGLMVPPGLSFNAISQKALAAGESSKFLRSFWDWTPILESGGRGYTPYTPATNLLFGLAAALDMLHEETLAAVIARHRRHASITRAAVSAWGIETVCQVPDASSDTLTAVMPAGIDADAVRRIALEDHDVTLGSGLGKLAGKAFRIGHLGDMNDTMLVGALAAVERALRSAGAQLAGSVDFDSFDATSSPDEHDPARRSISQGNINEGSSIF
jgi:alanine-glyoxylate transaminase / serine-glyoxylate transaminase / serine-pyruvate transaminase